MVARYVKSHRPLRRGAQDLWCRRPRWRRAVITATGFSFQRHPPL